MKHAYWHITPAAEAKLRETFLANPRRKWWPFDDSPSLATLKGKAKDFSWLYHRSRENLMARAGVAWTLQDRSERWGGDTQRRRRVIGFVWLPGVDGETHPELMRQEREAS